MQLFDKQRQDSFIFLTRPPAASGTDIVTSIALDKISRRVQHVRNPIPSTRLFLTELVLSNVAVFVARRS